jgi:hypothetical protein
MSACPETKSHLSKNEKVSFSLSLFIHVIDELWLNRRPTSRTSCGKKWMVLTQLGLREETTFISCFEYESVHHQHHPKREREWEKKTKRMIPSLLPFKSHFTIGRSHIYIWLLKKKQFLFWESYWYYP